MVKETPFSLSNFTPEANDLFVQAQRFTDESKHPLCSPAHLFAVMLNNNEIVSLLKDIGVSTLTCNAQLHAHLVQLRKQDGTSSISNEMVALSKRASDLAEERAVSVYDLFVALCGEQTGIINAIFKSLGITAEKIITSQNAKKVKNFDLNSCPYFTNLNDLKADPAISREEECHRILQILGRKSKNHPLLVGEPGIGKRTIILSVLDNVFHAKTLPAAFKGITVIELNVPALIAGAKNRAQVEDNLKTALKYLQGIPSIIYVRSLDQLTASGLSLNLADFLAFIFANKNIRVIAGCTLDTLKKFEKEPPLREFTPVKLEPSSLENTIQILRGVAEKYEHHHDIRIGEAVINTTAKLAKRYLQEKCLPESAIDLLDEAASHAKIQTNGMPENIRKALSRSASIKAQLTGLHGDEDDASIKVRIELEREFQSLAPLLAQAKEHTKEEEEEETTLTDKSIAQVLSEWTNIPADKFLQDDNDKLVNIGEVLSREVIDQAEAVNAIASAIRRSKTGLNTGRKPIGSFMFLGSSGVGKTLVAKSVAKLLFDSEENMVRFDMSEFMEKHTISKLIGSPPGYSGSEEGGMLTEAIRKKPYSVILFDEIEKAHADIFNLLLSVLDDGRLTDSKGKTVEFGNTIVILTSNLGSKDILDADQSLFDNEAGVKELHRLVGTAVKGFFRPELLNRIDSQVIFKPLSKLSLQAIFNLEVSKLSKALKESRGMNLEISPEAKNMLVDIGYNPAMGARPLQRAITDFIKTPLSDLLVSKKYKDGDTIHVLVESGNIIFE